MASGTESSFPPIRACLFDMDGLLIDSEEKYTMCTNTVLEKYGRPKIPWSIKAQLQGRPAAAAGAIFYKWAELPITREEYQAEIFTLQQQLFPTAEPLPGVPTLLTEVATAKVHIASSNPSKQAVHVALATSSHLATFKLKTTNHQSLFSAFPPHRRVLGDDPRIPKGHGKPAPDIWLLALKTINDSLPSDLPKIKPEECLVFEDSVPGVESGRRAGMRVVWVPHPELKKHYAGQERLVLAGQTGEGDEAYGANEFGSVDDGWGVELESLENFDWERYGIVVERENSSL